LLWIVRTREQLSFASIGLRPDGPLRSIGWGVALAGVCFVAVAACLIAFSVIGVRYGEGAVISRSLPITLLTVLRAGVSEEVFYRGYVIERVQSLTGSKAFAGAVSLAAFAGFHYGQGLPGVALALVLGGVVTAFYLWKRNLVATIIAHFIIDFVPNVLLPLFGA
jgi:membrane protease YdiL (CAAX protease family)